MEKSTSNIPIDISIDPIIKIGDLVFVKLSSGTGHLFWPALIESIQSKRTKKQSFTIVYFDSPTIPFEKKKGDLLQDDSKIYRLQINQTFVDHAYELVLNKKAYRRNTFFNIWSDIQMYYLTHSKSKEAARIQDCIDCIKHPRRHTKRVPKANVSVDNEDNKDEDLRMTSPQVHKEPAVLSTRNAKVHKGSTSSSSSSRQGIKTTIHNNSQKKQADKTLPKGYKEYRLVLSLTGMDGTIVKHQGPRLCSPERAKLYFPQQARTLLGVWTHNSHLLPPNYSACVTGYTNKNIAHILTFEMVRSEVSSMISTIASIAMSKKIDRASRSIKHKTRRTATHPNELSNELIHEFTFPDKDLQVLGEEFDITWDARDIGKRKL